MLLFTGCVHLHPPQAGATLTPPVNTCSDPWLDRQTLCDTVAGFVPRCPEWSASVPMRTPASATASPLEEVHMVIEDEFELCDGAF